MKSNYIVEVDLPSSKSSPEGYPKKLHISTLTIGALKKYSLITQSNANHIIKSIIEGLVVENIDVGTLYSSDIEFILIWLRINSFGNEYLDFPFDYECKYCEKITQGIINLSKLKIKELNGYTFVNNCKLSNGDVVSQKLITLNDEISVSESDEIRDEDRSELGLVAATIVNINSNNKDDGKSYNNLKDKVEYLKNLHSIDDYTVLSDFLNYFSFGYDLRTEVICPFCSKKKDGKSGLQVVELPFRYDLFIPKIRSKRTYKDAVEVVQPGDRI